MEVIHVTFNLLTCMLLYGTLLAAYMPRISLVKAKLNDTSQEKILFESRQTGIIRMCDECK